MLVNKITLNSIYKLPDNNKKNQSSSHSLVTEPKECKLPQNYSYFIPFLGERVDKGLGRFYSVNKDIMPVTLREYIESLDSMQSQTPLEANYEAFSNLEEAKTVEDIKTFFPDEPLFDNLKNAKDTNAKTGILNHVRQLKEAMELYETDVVKDSYTGEYEDLTVYLVKKIFLESKTLDQINKDLKKDLIPDIRFACEKKLKAKGFSEPYKYVSYSTISSLGIKTPDEKFRTSLRYTAEGYSDKIGDKISESLQLFMACLTREQRNARNKISITNFENWWFGLSENEKLELIASNDPENDMLETYKKSKRASKRKSSKTDKPEKEKSDGIKEKTPSKLAKDELFILWATHNLKAYENQLSQEGKDLLHLKRMNNAIQRWASMSTDERIEYISKMKAGAEPTRYAMIDAWNKCKNIILELSDFLQEKQVLKPVDLLYSSEEFSKFQSNIMREFWDNHPEFAQQLGDAIRASQKRVDDAIQKGEFSVLKNQINNEKKLRQNEIRAIQFRKAHPIKETTEPVKELTYKDEFVSLYKNALKNAFGDNLPDKYPDEISAAVAEDFSEDTIKIWIKFFNKNITQEEAKMLSDAQRSTSLSPKTRKIQHAFEIAVSDTLYKHLKDTRVFFFDTPSLKYVLGEVLKSKSPINFPESWDYPANLNNFTIKDHSAVNKKRMNQLYEYSKKDKSDSEIQYIIDNYFLTKEADEETVKKLARHLKTYGAGLDMIYSDKSAYPMESRLQLVAKILAQYETEEKTPTTFIRAVNLRKEPLLNKVSNVLPSKYYFLPNDIIKIYIDSIKQEFRKTTYDVKKVEMMMDKMSLRKKLYDSANVWCALPLYERRNMLKILAIRQVLADILYRATDNPKVYRLSFEELCEKIETASFVKTFPSINLPVVENAFDSELVLKRPLIKGNIKKAYHDYLTELREWEAENSGLESPDYKSMMYILNPLENEPEIDLGTAWNISKFPDTPYTETILES